MAYVQVDIDIDEFDNDDLIEEVVRRVKRNRLSKSERAELIEELQDLLSALNMDVPVELISINSLDDQIKYEHLAKIFNQYTTTEIETLLPIR